MLQAQLYYTIYITYHSGAAFSPSSTDLRKRNKGRKKVKGRKQRKKEEENKVKKRRSKFEVYRRRGRLNFFSLHTAAKSSSQNDQASSRVERVSHQSPKEKFKKTETKRLKRTGGKVIGSFWHILSKMVHKSCNFGLHFSKFSKNLRGQAPRLHSY